MTSPLVLGIETSCDETSVAVVQGRQVRANVVASQVEIHAQWGGVVPEAAARAHVDALLPTLQQALETAGVELGDVEAIAVTNRPGLVGALSVGVTAAKALAATLRVPLLGIHHLEGHLLSVLSLPEEIPFPHVALVVSGGHTELIRVESLGAYRLLGETRDDAAGEAFDKAARLLGLGYPGGLAIQRAAETGAPDRYPLPRGLAGDTRDFSFSGLKTAVLRLVEREGASLNIADAAASVQATIAGVLAERAVAAAEAERVSALSVVGGVAANAELRRRLTALAEPRGLRVLIPSTSLCTDNAAMIALAAGHRLESGQRDGIALEATATASLP